MARTCFSIEPGVYLKGTFGVRSEVDMYLLSKRPSSRVYRYRRK